MQFHKFFTSTLNEYQGLVAIIALMVILSPFTFKRVRHAIFNFFSKKDIHERLDAQDLIMGRIKKELTQNGGVGGQKDSTMKDNVQKALRDIAEVKRVTDQNSKNIKEIDSKVDAAKIEVANLTGQVSVLTANSRK